jgi:hypothetical protein
MAIVGRRSVPGSIVLRLQSWTLFFKPDIMLLFPSYLKLCRQPYRNTNDPALRLLILAVEQIILRLT